MMNSEHEPISSLVHFKQQLKKTIFFIFIKHNTKSHCKNIKYPTYLDYTSVDMQQSTHWAQVMQYLAVRSHNTHGFCQTPFWQSSSNSWQSSKSCVISVSLGSIITSTDVFPFCCWNVLQIFHRNQLMQQSTHRSQIVQNVVFRLHKTHAFFSFLSSSSKTCKISVSTGSKCRVFIVSVRSSETDWRKFQRETSPI